MYKAIKIQPFIKSNLSLPTLFNQESQSVGFNLIAKRFKKRKPPLNVKLLAFVENLGQPGEVVKVRPGYMRNVLYPKQLAQYVLKDRTQIHRAELELNKTKETTKEETTATKQTFAAYMRLARIHKELSTIKEVTFVRAVVGGESSESQLLYGSVTVDDLIRHLRDEHYLAIEKDSISLEKIKKTGTYTAQIDLGTIGMQPLTVKVVSDIPPQENEPLPDTVNV